MHCASQVSGSKTGVWIGTGAALLHFDTRRGDIQSSHEVSAGAVLVDSARRSAVVVGLADGRIEVIDPRAGTSVAETLAPHSAAISGSLVCWEGFFFFFFFFFFFRSCGHNARASSLRLISFFAAYVCLPALVSDIAVNQTMIASCGFSTRDGAYIVDPFIKIFDIRTFKLLAPVSFPVRIGRPY